LTKLSLSLSLLLRCFERELPEREVFYYFRYYGCSRRPRSLSKRSNLSFYYYISLLSCLYFYNLRASSSPSPSLILKDSLNYLISLCIISYLSLEVLAERALSFSFSMALNKCWFSIFNSFISLLRADILDS